MGKPDLSNLSIEELNDLIGEATRLRDRRVEEKKAELLKQIAELDALTGKTAKAATTRTRTPARHDEFEGEEGEQWSGRGGLPRWAKDKYGITDRAGMEQFRKYKR